MKKITLLLVFLLLFAAEGYSQCFNVEQYPSDTVVSENSGMPQEIAECNYTFEYAVVSNIAVGSDYIFTCTFNDDDSNRYITVTDLSNNVIAMGESPLTVSAITSSDIRVHFTDNSDCDGIDECHTTTIQAILTCPIPLNPVVSNITTTSANFIWEIGGSETAWEVLILPAGSDAPDSSTSGTAVTDTQYTATSLTQSSGYQFYVRANCGSEFSPWTLAVEFSAACDGIAAFSENFDSVATPDLPECWNALLRGDGLSEDAYIRTEDYEVVHSDPQSAELYNSDSGGDYDIILVSPNLSNLSAGTHRLKFYAKGYSDLQVGTLDDFSDTATFSIIEELSVEENASEYAVDFTSYSGSDTYIGIRLNPSNTYSGVFVDDIRWELSPSCPDVTEVAVPNVITDGATITWVSGGSEVSWDVAVGAPSVTDPNTLTFVNSTSESKDITGLTDNTDYKVWVRSVCAGNDNGAWIGPVPFKTACLPIAAFNENFDSVATPELPSCWTAILRGETLSPSAHAYTINWNDVHSQPNAIEMYNSSSNSAGGDDIILVSPNLSSLASGTYRLKFYAKNQGSLQVGTLDSNTDLAVFSMIEEISTSGATAQYTVDFTVYNGTDTYIGIRLNNSNSFTSVFIDDVLWEVAPTCADVTEVAVPAVTTDGATVTWIAGGSEISWDVAVGASSVTDPSTLPFVNSASESKDLTGLTDATTYNVWVRSVCAGNDNGAWIGPVTFTTACLPIAAFTENFDAAAIPELPSCWTKILRGDTLSEYANVQTVDWNDVHSDPNSVEMYNSSSNTSGTDDIILVSPNLSSLALGTYRLKFYAKSTGSLQVGTLDSNTDAAIFSPIEEIATTDNATQYAVDFTVYNGSDTYIGFRMNNSNTYTYVYIDDVIWEVAPSCADVTDIDVVPTGTTTADITWVPGGAESQWNVAYTLVNVTDPTTATPINTTDAALTLNTLSPATTYNVWVRSVCAGGADLGAWIGPIAFTTACESEAAATMELQDFESGADGALPVCWAGEVVAGTNKWELFTPGDFGDITSTHSGDKIVFKNYQNSDAFLYSLPLDFTGVTQPATIDMWLHRHQNAHPADKYTVYVNTVPSVDGAEMVLEQLSLITQEPSVPSTGFYNYQALIPESFNGQPFVYVIVEGLTQNGFSSYALGLDDFKVQFDPLSTPVIGNSKFAYYPNPVKDFLNVTNSTNITSVTVLNLLGQQVLVQTNSGTSAKVDMSALASGAYIVKLTADNMTKTIKVVKE